MVAEMITKIGIPSDAIIFTVIVTNVLGVYMISYERKEQGYLKSTPV